MQGPLAQISWYSSGALLDKAVDKARRLWYARKAFENGWSQPVLCLQIESRAYERAGKAVNNFPAALPPADLRSSLPEIAEIEEELKGD